MKLKIENNDPRPFISFTTTLTTGRYFDGTSLIKLSEGDKGTFRVVLDRKSNRAVEVHIYSDGDFRPFFDANGVDPIRYARTHIGRRYFEDMGFWPGNRSWDDVIGPGPLVIPAGELGLTFTVDTTLLENDLYDYIDEDYFGTVYLKMNHPVYAYTDEASGKVHFRVLQDEPTPELSFRSADDGDATITVREGESFDVKIDIDPELGRYHRVWNSLLPGISLASQLTATAVTGEVPDWELPDVEIVPGLSGATVTVQIPADSLANGERTVVLDFEDALLSYTRSHLTVPPRIKNSLVVTILDAEPPVVVPPSQPPVVRVRAVSETILVEGSSVLLAVELTNAPESGAAQDITVHLDTGSGTTLTRRDNREPNYPSSVTIPQGQSRVEFNIKVRRNAWTEDSDVINLYVSSVDYGGENYEQSDLGVDLTITDYIAMPIVTILDHQNPLYADRIHTVNEGPYSARLYVRAHIPSTHMYEDFITVPRDVVVHLAARNITTSDSDYSFPSSVTVQRGRAKVDFLVQALDDDLVEFDETFEIYVTSVEYRGKTFEISDAGVRLTISNYDDVIQTSIKVPGGVDQLEGTTVTVQVELSEELPANAPANSVKLAFTPRDSARTVGQLPYIVDITEDLRGSTIVAVPFFLATDYLQEQADLVDLSVVISNDELRQIMSRSQSYFRIVADDGQNYEQPDTGADLTIIDNSIPPIVTIRQVWPGVLYEEEYGWRPNPRWSDSELWRRSTVFEAVLTNAPESGAAETITVYLETGDSTTASASDYSYPDIVTIPPGESVERFTIRARVDSWREYRETLNVYVSSVDYLGQNYEQSDSGVDLNIIGDHKIQPKVTVLGGNEHQEGSTVTVRIELREVLPARIPTGSVKLAISLAGNTRSVAVDGQPHLFVGGQEPFVIDITEDLKNSTLVDLSFHLIDNYSLEETSLMKIEWIVAREESIPFSPVRGNRFKPILLENAWSFSFSIVDDDGPDPDNDGLDPDNDLAPIITFLLNPLNPRATASRIVYEGRHPVYSLPGYSFWVPEKSFWVELTDAPPGGASHDITVHLATQNGATASASDYSYPSSVTIPRGQSRALVSVRAVDDDELEQNEHFTIYASSIDYRGRSYEQSDASIQWWIRSDEEIQSSITPLGGVDQVKGRTVTVRIEISEVPPPDIRRGSAQLSFLLSGSTRAVDATVDGKPYILGTNELWWTSLSLPWEHFRNSTTLDIPFYLADDGLPEESGLTLLMRYDASFWGFNSTGVQAETKGLFRVIDNDDLPLVSVRSLRSDTSTPLTSTSSVRRSDLNSVNEGDIVQLVAELTNAPEGGAAEDITVHLATESGTTASESDYSYPSSVTIPRGQSRVTFEVSALQDDLVEDNETLNIYVNSVDYNGQNYGQSDAGADLTIVDVDNEEPPVVRVRAVSETSVYEGDSLWLEAELINAPEGGAVEDITVNLVSRNIFTISSADYRSPSSVTIPQGQSRARFEVWALDDDLAENGELLNIYVSSVDYRGRNYKQAAVSVVTGVFPATSKSGVNLLILDTEPPIVEIRPVSDSTVYEGGSVWLEASIVNLIPDLVRPYQTTVHLATGNATTATESEYSFLSNVTIPSFRQRVRFEVRVNQDDLAEFPETLNIYASSVEFNGQNYEQSDVGTDLNIYSYDDTIQTSITVLGGTDQLEGTTVTVRVELSQALPANTPANAVQLSFSPNSNARTVDGLPFVLDITEALRESTLVEVPFYLTDDNLLEQTGLVDLKVKTTDYSEQLGLILSGAQSFFRIIDNDNDDNEQPTVAVHPVSDSTVYEGRSILLEAVLTNAPQDGTVTVNLASLSATTASEADYAYPSSVTIPRGQSRVEFEVSALQDDLVEDRETFIIYASSFEYGGKEYRQGELFLGVWIDIYDADDAPAVTLQQVLPTSTSSLLDLGDHGVIYEGGRVWLLASLTNAPADGTIQDITVNLATRSSSTASESDYVYPNSVTIPQGEHQFLFQLDANYDGLEELDETLNIYVSSVDYGGQNYEQSDSGINLTIVDNRKPPIVVLRAISDTTIVEGESVTLEVELTNPLPGGARDDFPVVFLYGSETTASYNDDYIFSTGSNRKGILEGQTHARFNIISLRDDLAEGSETLNLYIYGVFLPDYDDYYLTSKIYQQFGSSINLTIIDNEPPVVAIRSLRDTSTSLTSTSSVRRSDLNSVNEGDTVQLEVELTNASEGGAPQDITVNLATGNGATASGSDYSYPSSVTIPQGQSRVTFEVQCTPG